RDAASLRGTAAVLLGLNRLPRAQQREVLRGRTARQLADRLVERTSMHCGVGDLALVAWAAAETGAVAGEVSVARLLAGMRHAKAITTTQAAWALSALAAAHDHSCARPAADEARR